MADTAYTYKKETTTSCYMAVIVFDLAKEKFLLLANCDDLELLTTYQWDTSFRSVTHQVDSVSKTDSFFYFLKFADGELTDRHSRLANNVSCRYLCDAFGTI